MKICYKCKSELELSSFGKNKSKSDGLSSECKSCRKELNKNSPSSKDYNKQYYIDNRDKIIEQVKSYAKKHVDEISEYQKGYREENKTFLSIQRQKWRLDNADYLREYYRNRNKVKKKEDPTFLLAYQIRKRTNVAFKRTFWKKKSSNQEMLGCTYKQAREHIESLFTDDMSWDNYGRGGWHIDHKKPLSSAITEADFTALCHYKNLQPLWEFDNLSKGSKY